MITGALPGIDELAIEPSRYHWPPLNSVTHAHKYRDLIEALKAAPSERPFVTLWIDDDEQETVSFGEFRRQARAQAKAFRSRGVGAGDRVIIVMPQGIAAMAAFAGAMMLGAVPAFLAYPNFKIEPAKYRTGLEGVTANLRAKVVMVDEEFPDEMLSYLSGEDQSIVLRSRGSNEDDGGFDSASPDNRGKGLAFIQHSAGTTGLQKGVALTHTAVLKQIEHLSEALKIDTATDRIYSWLPLYHDMGLIACFMLPMVCHLHVVMQSPLDWVMHPESMLQIVSQHRCTLAWMPNFAFQFVPRRTRRERWGLYDLSSLRALINCSEPVRESSMQEFRKAFSTAGLKASALQSSYAMAENVFAVTQSDVSEPLGPAVTWADGEQFRKQRLIVAVAEGTAAAVVFRSSGRVLPNQEVRISSDDGSFLEAGKVGEIVIRGDCCFSGYYNRADLTRDTIIDGWYHTGDLGFFLERELFVVGRKKDFLIVGGENLYPQDVEELAASHSAIHDGRVVAMGVYNPDLGTDEIVLVAEVEREEELDRGDEIEREIRNLVIKGMGVAIHTIFLKAPKWIVKSTAGKAARLATREKLLREHPELNREREEGKT